MKCKVVGLVPTIYQMDSLSKLAGECNKEPGGAFSFKKEFNTITDARDFLKARMDAMFSANGIDEKEYREGYKDIKKYGQISYDAATLKISFI